MTTSSDSLATWEQAEVKRSALEATLIPDDSLRDSPANIARYLNPPANTVYPLEYAYHLLGDVRGKIVVDYGCGDGRNTLLLALRGAHVKALDISPDLIEIAKRRLAVNEVDVSRVEFIVGSAHESPLPDNSVDVVFGMAILHHLDLQLSANEVHRILKPGGRAIFQEPLRNSRLIKFVRSLIPYQAPDVSPYERPLTSLELERYGKHFSAARLKEFSLPTSNLIGILPFTKNKIHESLRRDARWLAAIPALRYFASNAVLEVTK